MTVAVSQPLPGVVQALLDRPESRNAIDLDMVGRLLDVVGDEEARVIVLGSTSQDALSAGADLKLSDADRAEVSRELYRLYEMMRTTSAIILVAFSGHAVGGGAQLVVASDFTVAGHDATIRFRGPGHGIAVGAWALSGMVGRGRAIDLALSMRPVSAKEALDIGLIQRIDRHPLAYANSLAEEIISLWPSAVAAVKRIVGIPDPLQALAAEKAHNEGWDGAVPPYTENGPDLAG
ncbi:MAG TPA: enoyl-CoA hydratase/isomerase family protein [Acidimicrobiia bacterium]|nr:enoyl-CoA hydratase/isomerase family protein [Acidimicrobiia bacterium]